MTAVFSEPTAAWFEAAFPCPTEVQRRGWETIATGRHALLIAPTGSGKPLAAFLIGIDRCLRLPPAAPEGVRVLYVSPLKALVHDVERNLRAPLQGIRQVALRRGTESRTVSVDVRTGDTPAQARRLQARHPADILVTTPESLFLLLASRAREILRTVHTVIVDEVHALAPFKRGSHLALSLEWLADLAESDPQRIGLSATVRPADQVAAWLGGRDRPVAVVDASRPPALDLRIVLPIPRPAGADAREDREAGEAAGPSHTPAPAPGGSILSALYRRGVPPHDPAEPTGRRGVWPLIYPALLEEVRSARSSIVFVNSRGLCERLANQLNELAGEVIAHAHHGSLSRERRSEIEDALKAGRIRAIVATSSLELGIDIGELDACVMLGYPGSIASFWQQAGRAGRRRNASVAVMVSSATPLDQYLAAHPEYLFRQSPEHARLAPDNLGVLAAHVACATFELPFMRGDRLGRAEVSDLLDALAEAGDIHASGAVSYTHLTLPTIYSV